MSFLFQKWIFHFSYNFIFVANDCCDWFDTFVNFVTDFDQILSSLSCVEQLQCTSALRQLTNSDYLWYFCFYISQNYHQLSLPELHINCQLTIILSLIIIKVLTVYLLQDLAEIEFNCFFLLDYKARLSTHYHFHNSALPELNFKWPTDTLKFL